MNEKQHRLVIVGSLKEFVALTEMAKERGYYTIVCDGYPDGPAKKIADKAYTIDVRNVEEFAQMCIDEQADGIIGSFSDLLFEQITKIADRVGLRWYAKPDKLPYYREKDQTKRLLSELGVCVPKNRKLSRNFKDSDLDGYRFPVVIKPINGYGSKGIFVVKSPKEIRQQFDEVVKRSSGAQSNILVEEYSYGREYNMMSWVVDGKVYPISIADEKKTPQKGGTLPVVNRIAYPAKEIGHILDEARDVQQKFVTAVGQSEGAISMQFFYSDRGVEVCEIAGRLFGYEHELVTYCCGLSIEKLLLDYVYEPEKAKETMMHHDPCFTKSCAVLYFMGKQGKRVADLKAMYDLAQDRHVLEYYFFYKPGEVIDNFSAKPYLVLYDIEAETRIELDNVTNHFFESAFVADENGERVDIPAILEKD